MASTAALDTIWEVDEVLYSEVIEPILLEFWPPKATGRKPACWRTCLNGILYVMRTGCQWNALPEAFGDDATVHRWFQRWADAGLLEKIWAVLIERCDELGGVEWKWQAADGSLGKARFGGPISVPTRRTGRKTAPR